MKRNGLTHKHHLLGFLLWKT